LVLQGPLFIVSAQGSFLDRFVVVGIWPSADFVATSDPHWLFFGNPTRVVGFLKALVVPVTNLPWAAESHFAFTFKSVFSCCGLLWF
jgi:hypothetical protein